ncbi:MAG: arginyltransferase [Tepidisphaeraceae bacterium]
MESPEPPFTIRLTTLPPVPCPYLPGRVETVRAILASTIDGGTYRAFLDANFRRSGRMIYQPVCDGCSECKQIRIPTWTFEPSTSQRRTKRRNEALTVSIDKPVLTDEKFDLYARYVRDWHGKEDEADAERLRSFLYDAPLQALEFCYRDEAGKLLAVGLCDVMPDVLSSVYFYFDPAEAKRGLGTYGAIYEIEWAARNGFTYYYPGYYIRDCPAMSYKANFRPAEVLESENVWRILP